MPKHTGLSNFNIIGFVSIVDVERAKAFYRDALGLRLLNEEPPFALVFDANGIMLRLAMVKQLPPAHGTVIGWQVSDIKTVVDDLASAGVQFERYGFLGNRTTPPSGPRPPAPGLPGSKTPMEIL